MTECKVMIEISMKEAKARFREYEDMEFEKRGKHDFSPSLCDCLQEYVETNKEDIFG